MEIILSGIKYGIASVFKIDLIVWKYLKSNEIDTFAGMFKIDLIVWKLCYPERSINSNIQFKIDLIVWKYTSTIIV